MALDERLLRLVQKRFHYSDDQLEIFKNNPRNEILMNKLKIVSETILILTVMESNGCNSNHKVGDKIYLDGCGNILTKHCPVKICSYALNNALLMVFAANEFLYNEIDPMNMCFKRSSCFDAGINCGGLGRIVLELSVASEEQIALLKKE